MKSEQINNYTEVKQQTNRDVRQLGVLVSESYEAESTDQQIVINLNMSIDINNKKQVWVFVDGVKLTEGAGNNYTFTNVVSNVSAQITLSAPLIAGLPIQVYKLGAYQESFPNPSSVTATLLNDVAQPHKMALAAFQPFVQKTFVTAPNTLIQNRAQVEAGSLKAIAGVERIHFRSIVLSRTEFGPNGESVWELDNKDARFRFVGTWTNTADSQGTKPNTFTINDFMEVTFYGTGLNLMYYTDTSVAANFRATVDGGTESGDLYVANSSVLSNRNYGKNVLINITQGLSLGWHTVKIRDTASGGNGIGAYGIEILNERTNLAILAGTGYGGMKQEVLSALSTSAFNAGVTGTRGARVVKYLQNNAISQAVQEVNGASAFLTSADHTNEEIARKINFREFGVNRGDDFSTLAGANSARAFTLDDGTTTLTGSAVNVYTDATYGDGVGHSTLATMTITFVGTGLDIRNVRNSTTGVTNYSVDGVSNGAFTVSAGTGNIVKVVSGLPYGTHTVAWTYVSGPVIAISDFFIYQPKKPSIPSGAIEVADYNVMANYSAATNGLPGYIGQGVLRKLGARETVYVGAGWTGGTIDTNQADGGIVWGVSASGSYAEYTFFGTGGQWMGYFFNSVSNTTTLTVDGASLSGLTISLVQGTGTGLSLSSSGVITGNPSSSTHARVSIQGLSLGKHTIRMTNTSGSISVYHGGFDVITPIHINNTKVGSLSLKDSRVFSPIVDKPSLIDLTKAKAWVQYDQINSKIIGSYNISQCLSGGTGNTFVYFAKPFKNANYAIAGASKNFEMRSNPSSSTFCQIILSNSAGTVVNEIFYIVVFGELEQEDEQEF